MLNMGHMMYANLESVLYSPRDSIPTAALGSVGLHINKMSCVCSLCRSPTENNFGFIRVVFHLTHSRVPGNRSPSF